MLDMKRPEDKTFEEWMEDARQKIPMYSSEWTNYNPSDPGITILENLTAFHVLQQSQMGETTPGVRRKLLKLAGITQYPGKCARVLLEPENLKEPAVFPANQQFLVGDTVFETEQPCRAGGHKVLGVYGMDKGELIDGELLLDSAVPLSVRIFGENPEVGNGVYFIMDSLPEGEDLHFYIRIVKVPYRNDFVESVNNRFASVTWQCYTEDGFQDIWCRDRTGAFLTDGELVFRGIKNPAIYRELPRTGYCIRGILRQVSYDIAPQLFSVHGFLLEAYQRETSCIAKSFKKSREIEISCNLLRDGYFRVFCREGEGRSYRRYDQYDGIQKEGRYYELRKEEEGKAVLGFDRQRFGYGPVRVKDAIRVVIYNEEMMQRYDLGVVYGYDRQEIALPAVQIVPDNFCLLAERRDEDGGFCYDFVKPKRTGDGELRYELLESEGKIRILDAGDYIEARLFLANLSVYQGENGNVRENSRFTAEGDFGELVFRNPAPGTGGRFRESEQMAAKRFYDEMKGPETAVCAGDYENMVHKISGLCIQKVRAVMDYEKNEVLVAVKPWSEDAFPRLTPLYKSMLEKYFEPRRLLTTRIRFSGPRYVGIDVRGVIYVKRHYERYMDEIEAVLKKHLDYRAGNQNFGDVLRFEELFYELEHLECIASLQNLVIYPQNLKMASVEGMDIHPARDCLCYPGNFYLDIHAGQPERSW